jgi:flavorubredoxin
MGAVDWNRRLFDSLIPLPDGTSYNAYLVRGSAATALLDTVEPHMEAALMRHLEGVERIDYLVSHHAEQDHSGLIPMLLDRYPEAQLLCTAKAMDMLVDHVHLPTDRMRAVEDGESVSLGDKTLHFLYTPWVHWPETMVSYLPEDKVLFSCDFFGSHLATDHLYASEHPALHEAAKRYYAEIMMPFRKIIQRNLEKIEGLPVELIAPSHGPIYDQPDWIVDAYRDWVSDRVDNLVVIPYVSMHGSTEAMVEYLAHALVERGVRVQRFNLIHTDVGELAMSLVEAATVVIGTPTVNMGPHPTVFAATNLANSLRPKVRYVAIIGSYGWGTKAVEQLSGLIPNLKVDVLGTVMCKGAPRAEDEAALDELADSIQARHAQL